MKINIYKNKSSNKTEILESLTRETKRFIAKSLGGIKDSGEKRKHVIKNIEHLNKDWLKDPVSFLLSRTKVDKDGDLLLLYDDFLKFHFILIIKYSAAIKCLMYEDGLSLDDSLEFTRIMMDEYNKEYQDRFDFYKSILIWSYLRAIGVIPYNDGKTKHLFLLDNDGTVIDYCGTLFDFYRVFYDNVSIISAPIESENEKLFDLWAQEAADLSAQIKDDKEAMAIYFTDIDIESHVSQTFLKHYLNCLVGQEGIKDAEFISNFQKIRDEMLRKENEMLDKYIDMLHNIMIRGEITGEDLTLIDSLAHSTLVSKQHFFSRINQIKQSLVQAAKGEKNRSN